MKNKYMKLIAVAILIIIFVSLGHKVKGSKEGIYFDEKILKKVDENITSVKTKVMKIITFFGSYKFLLPVGLLILLFMVKEKNWVSAIFLILASIGSFGINTLLKYYYIRTRPIKYFLIEKGGYSFPSGHAMVSMTFYTIITYLLTRDKLNNRKNIMLWILNFIIIGLIGYSRIYLGVHWPTDVIGGYTVGILFSYCIILSEDTIERISLNIIKK